ncbi:hypothetical protein H6F95_13260 [Cyanobacteria bacterium FACHB-471]|nr:hypothetical protein [Cyanobacteria bacterium FACHB-471]
MIAIVVVRSGMTIEDYLNYSDDTDRRYKLVDVNNSDCTGMGRRAV